MTNRQRQILAVARDRAAHIREFWEPERVSQPRLTQGLLARAWAAHRSLALGPNDSTDSLAIGLHLRAATRDADGGQHGSAATAAARRPRYKRDS